MLSSQTSYQWLDGFGDAHDDFEATFVDPQTLTQPPSLSDAHTIIQPSNVYFNNGYLDLSEYRARAKKMSHDRKYGNPSHTRIQSVHRIRPHSPSQHPRSIDGCPAITETRNKSQVTRIPPPASTDSSLDTREEEAQGHYQWWPANINHPMTILPDGKSTGGLWNPATGH